MKNKCREIRHIVLITAALFMSDVARAAANTPAAGIVVMTVGTVTANGGEGGEHPLHRRSNVFTGETIITGKESRAQIRFADGALVSLQEGTQFRVENFSYKQTGKRNDATYRLLKGGMRTISGAIGKVNRDEYKVETPVATIGIRGTDYELMLHDGDNSGSDELYGYINDGVINTSNKAGSHDFSDNEFFKIAGSDRPPESLLNPPPFMFEGYVPENLGGRKDAGDLTALDPSFGKILTSTETGDLINSAINPMITPYATVTQLTGIVSYGIPPGGSFAIDQNSQVANDVSGMAFVDFSLQEISSIGFTANFADGKSVSLSSSQASSISSVIGNGTPIILDGGCSGGSTGCPPPLVAGPTPMTGSATIQFVGPNAEGISTSFSAQDAKNTQTINGTTIYTQDAAALYQ